MVLIQRKEYNILLLGQTGCGKSTFINSFLNYLSFESIDDVLRSRVKYCIPTYFTWSDPCSADDKQYIVTLGMHGDETEHQVFGESGTQDVRCYLFNVGDIGIHLIDTPGFGDTQGRKKDDEICDNLLQFLIVHEELRDLHAVLFIFKPQDTRMTVFFEYCMKHIFTKLHKNAAKNIAFLFTHTKATDYRPGPTSVLIQNRIAQSTDGNILFERRNKFCVDNDCIMYLYAYFYNNNELTFDDATKNLYTLSWKKSAKECLRFIEYIKTLEPHSVNDTIALNKISSHHRKLQAILPIILEHINIETDRCRGIENEMNDCGSNMERLKHALYKYIEVHNRKPSVVCRNRRCSKRQNEKSTVTCCDNCTAWTLKLCTQIAMWNSTCKKCGCNELDHVFTEVELRAERNINVENDIEQRQITFNRLKLFRSEQIIKQKKYEAEKNYIENCMERLSQFLTEICLLSDRQRQSDGESLGDLDSQMGEMVNTLSNLDMTGKEIREALREQKIPQKSERAYYIEPVLDSWKNVCEIEDC